MSNSFKVLEIRTWQWKICYLELRAKMDHWKGWGYAKLSELGRIRLSIKGKVRSVEKGTKVYAKF